MTPSSGPDVPARPLAIGELGATEAAWRGLACALAPRALVLLDGTLTWRVRTESDGVAFEPVPVERLPALRIECDLARLARGLPSSHTPVARAFALLALLGSERAALGVRWVGDGEAPTPIAATVDLAPELLGDIGAAVWPQGLHASLEIVVGEYTWRFDLGNALAIDCAPRGPKSVDSLARAARAQAASELALAVEPATGAWALSLPLEPADLAGLVGPEAAAALERFVADALRHARSVALTRTLAFDLVRDGAPWLRLWLAKGRLSSTAPVLVDEPLVLGCDLAWVRRLLALPRGASRRAAAWLEALLPRRLRFAVAEEEVVALVPTRDSSGRDQWLAAGGGEHQLGELWEGEQWRATLAPDGQVLSTAIDASRAPTTSVRAERIAIRVEGEAEPIALGGTLEPSRSIAWGPAARAAEHGLAASVLPGSRGTARLAVLDELGAVVPRCGVAHGRALVIATSGLRWRAFVDVRETRLYAVVASARSTEWSAIACVCAPAGLETLAAFRKAAPAIMACRWGDTTVLPALGALEDAPRLDLPAGVQAVPLSGIATPLDRRARYSARLRLGLVGSGLVGVAVIVHPFEPPRSSSEPAWDERPVPLEMATGPGGLRVSRGRLVLFELRMGVHHTP